MPGLLFQQFGERTTQTGNHRLFLGLHLGFCGTSGELFLSCLRQLLRGDW